MVGYKEVDYCKLAESYEGTAKDEMSMPNVGQVMALKVKSKENKGVIITNTHLFWNWKYNFVRLRQAVKLIEEAILLNESLHYDVIMCGDFNMNPNSVVYHLLTSKHVPPEKINHYLTPADHHDDDSNSLTLVVEQGITVRTKVW
jgi:mRNA deadenylase 3'-5' endonuclease subunit Ccr4